MYQMTATITFEKESQSNQIRGQIDAEEPIGLRTFTPSQAVLAKSAGLYHWTPEGRRLADFSSGVLVSNLGHNPKPWLRKFLHYLGWDSAAALAGEGFAELVTLTAYNAITPIEAQANHRLLASLRSAKGGGRMERVLWSASGSEGVQKALKASLHFHPERNVILATRNGFHGKKGLAEAVTGDENSPERDPRVRFISFPKAECYDVSKRGQKFDPAPYAAELSRLKAELGGRLNCLITEPYLGGGGSYHPPPEYLQLLVRFCRDNDMPFILDEVQSNFGRTGTMYAFEKYGIEPDIVVLGKGLGNGVPVNCAVGRADIFGSMGYGEGSDTWSANPIGCAAVLATLDIFAQTGVMSHVQKLAAKIEAGLKRLKELKIVAAVRGEGVVWGVEFADAGKRTSKEVAIECVRACYLGDANGDGIHLLGPLAGNVVRISPPFCMTEAEADHWFGVLYGLLEKVQRELSRV